MHITSKSMTRRLPKSLVAAIVVALSMTSVFAQTLKQEKSETSVQQRVVEMEKRVQRLETELRLLSTRVLYRTATLDCNNGKYVEFLPETSSIVLFASCAKIEPYLEGHRVTLEIGNPTTFNLNNISGDLYYGKNLMDAFNRSAAVSSNESVRSGAWNRIVVTINPSKPEDMRHLELSLKATSVGPAR